MFLVDSHLSNLLFMIVPQGELRNTNQIGCLFRRSHSFFFLLLLLFTAAPAAYGSSRARGQIGAAVAGLPHSSWQLQILNPMSEARDQTHNPTDTMSGS